ncbi:zinc finger protein 91-like [Culicoides brevitarsis]|uniref:zinc finger protein 91-like n=1 Tax=Culicoides brevitarsis TaxID=469753 RepID=UPI00307BA4E3
MEVAESCRGCLKPLSVRNFKLSEALEGLENVVTYQEAFEKCSGYFINPSEPQEICEECAGDLFHAFRFKQKCEKTQDQMLKWIKNVEIKEENVEIFAEPIVTMEMLEPEVHPEPPEPEKSQNKNWEYWRCEICEIIFKCREYYEKHVLRKHPETRTESCPYCQKLQFPQLLLTHLRSCRRRPKLNEEKKVKSTYRPFKCEICGSQYEKREILAIHYKKKHPEEKESCPHCKMSFHPKMLESHINICWTKRRRRKRFLFENDDEDTQTPDPDAKKPRLCPICGLLKTEAHIIKHVRNGNDPYVCDICGKVMNSKISIRRHIKTVHLRLPVKCCHCKKEFPTPHLLLKHVRYDHPEDKEVFKCDFCERTFLNTYHMKKHRATHTGERFFQCNICGKEFILKTSYDNHLTTHSDERPFPCELCGATFKTKKNMKKHIKQVHDEKSYECPLCDRAFAVNFLILQHLKKAHPEYQLPPKGTSMKKIVAKYCRLTESLEDVEKPVTYQEAFEKCSGYFINPSEPQEICEECAGDLFHAYRFKQKCEKTQDQMLKYLKNVEIKEEKVEIFAEPLTNLEFNEPDSTKNSKFEEEIWKCDLCKAVFKCLKSIRNHMHNAHPENLTEKCQFCKKLQHPQLLDAHKKVCKSRPPDEEKKYKKNQQFQCEICGLCRKFTLPNTQEVLQTPLLVIFAENFYKTKPRFVVTSNEFIYDCQSDVVIAKKEFPSAFLLRKHVRFDHPEDKQDIKCDFCGRKFLNRYHMKLHRATHTGETFFKCKICDKGFIQRSALDKHMTSHSNERPYVCDFCGEKFKNYPNLTNHVQQVHEEKNYECPVCQKNFTTNYLTVQHLKKMHPDYELPPKGTSFMKNKRK